MTGCPIEWRKPRKVTPPLVSIVKEVVLSNLRMGGLTGILTRDVSRCAFSSMWLPSQRTDKSNHHPAGEGAMYPDGYGQRVLVVDDDANVRSLLSVLLRYEGYNVFEVGDGLDAFQELKKRHFDVVISDYRMPRFDGMQLLAVCRIAWPETAVVIVSGEDSDWTDRAIRGGAHAWVKKPWERTHLIGVLRQAIEKVSARTAPQQVRA